MSSSSAIKTTETNEKDQDRLSGNKESKPPNVLVYTKDESKGDKFLLVKETLRDILGIDAYTFYHLSEDKALNYPWKENTTLLIILDKTLKEQINNKFYDYHKSGGNILSLCCRTFEENFLEIKNKGEICLEKSSLECSVWKDVPVTGYSSVAFEKLKITKFKEIAWFSNNKNRPAILFLDSIDKSGKLMLSHVRIIHLI